MCNLPDSLTESRNPGGAGNLTHDGTSHRHQFIGIIFSTMLLLGYSNLVDASRYKYIAATVIAGAAGSLHFFLLYWVLPPEFEMMIVFFGSYLVAGLMFVFMVLSGFKAK